MFVCGDFEISINHDNDGEVFASTIDKNGNQVSIFQMCGFWYYMTNKTAAKPLKSLQAGAKKSKAAAAIVEILEA